MIHHHRCLQNIFLNNSFPQGIYLDSRENDDPTRSEPSYETSRRDTDKATLERVLSANNERFVSIEANVGSRGAWTRLPCRGKNEIFIIWRQQARGIKKQFAGKPKGKRGRDISRHLIFLPAGKLPSNLVKSIARRVDACLTRV